MKRYARIIASTLALALVGCGGGASAPSAAPPVTPPGPQAATVPTNFTFTYSGKSTASGARAPKYLTANVKSVTIAFTAYNGGPIPSGSTNTTVTSNLALTGCPCTATVAGPSVPPGSDTFSLTTYDANGGSGNVVSTASPTLVIQAGQANSNTIALDGVPHAFLIGALPSGTAGSSFAATPFTLTVQDVDGNTILGTYANPVTITDSDTSSLTQGSALSVNGGAAATSVTSTASGDLLTLAYGGLAIAPATLTASAAGATNGTATFTPALSPIVYSGPLVASLPEIDLYATSGTGSTGTFTASETGWTNAPYNRSITQSLAAGCSSIATASPASGTSFTDTVAASPSAGTCTQTLSDFIGGQTKTVTVTYTTSGIGVQ